MNKKKKSKGFVVGCVAMAVMLAVSTYISLVVFGVVAEEKKNGGQNQGYNSWFMNSSEDEATDNDDSQNNNYNDANVNQNNGGQGTNQNNSSDSGTDNNGSGVNQNNNSLNTNNAQVEYYLNTKKTAKEVIDIYATIMNNTKSSKPGFTKIEYQDLPGDAANRVVTDGAESIETVFGFIETLGLIVDEDTARKEPYIHERGDEMSKFPVFDRSKGSYLTDPNGVKNYTYQKDKNGNIKLVFTLVDENNPEPIGENSNTAPSYTGAVFSPMSKAKIDNTVNHPIVSVFAKNIKYSLKYHDCKVEMVFNPQNGQIVSLNHFAYINLSGSGDVAGGRMALEKQELVTVVMIKDFKY